MDATQEYEVESITRARVHDKRGKKITWRYYVKWKGYGWDECTWEPTDSFQGGSEHILESFWERIDTAGRDISDATAFKKGEELLISGPPGRKSLKRKTNPSKSQVSTPKNVSSSDGATASAPPLATRKRRRVQVTVDNNWGYLKTNGKVPATDPKNAGTSTRLPKRRRVSSPGPRKSGPKRLPSVGDSQLDADGETDPDVVEVEDELMQVSAEDVEEDSARSRFPTAAGGGTNEPKKIAFDDLEHFYSGNPIDIDQNTDEHVAGQKPETRPRLQSPFPTNDVPPDSQAPVSPALGSSDHLFGSPSHPSDEAQEDEKNSILPFHRARAANPLVKLIDTTTPESTGKQSRITAKARLMSVHIPEVPSANGSKRGGSGRSSGLTTKNRSSLLTATKGALKSVKGKFKGTAMKRDQPDEIEEVPAAHGASEGDKDNDHVASWSDEGATANRDHTVSNSQPGPPPSGDELLKLAGFQADIETLPDYEDNSQEQPQDVETQGSNFTSAPAEEKLPEQSLVEVTDASKASEQAADTSPSVSEVEQKAPVATDPSVPSVVAPPADEVVKTNIELAKEHLFPSTQTSFGSFSTVHSSFRSTIFGPLYQGFTVNHMPIAKNEPSSTFRVILGDGVELPLVLKDCAEIKARISDILVGNSSGSKVAVFYSAEDALTMVSTLRGAGTARVVLDPSAETVQQECFSTFLQRFEASYTLVAPVGKEVCVLYSSENTNIAEKLGAPANLIGLSSTLLISHASIENQLAYVAAIMKAAAI